MSYSLLLMVVESVVDGVGAGVVSGGSVNETEDDDDDDDDDAEEEAEEAADDAKDDREDAASLKYLSMSLLCCWSSSGCGIIFLPFELGKPMSLFVKPASFLLLKPLLKLLLLSNFMFLLNRLYKFKWFSLRWYGNPL